MRCGNDVPDVHVEKPWKMQGKIAFTTTFPQSLGKLRWSFPQPLGKIGAMLRFYTHYHNAYYLLRIYFGGGKEKNKNNHREDNTSAVTLCF
jgi:hypothetical protein